MKAATWILALVVTAGMAAGQSLTGNIDPTDANDVLLLTFTLSAPSSLNVQSFGYGGSGNAPGGKNAAGTVIAPGGFDPYISLFTGVGPTATFVASNDDGVCPPGTATGASCPDSTLAVNNLPAGSYILAMSVFDNFSFAENLGSGDLGDLFIGLGNYYDAISNTVRTSNYAIDLAATGLQIGSVTTLDVVSPPVIGKAFTPNKVTPGGTATVSFNISNPNPLSALTGVGFNDSLPGLVVAAPSALTSNCAGAAIAIPGSGTISLAGAAIAPSGSCTVTTNVTAVSEGVYINSVLVTSANGGAGNTSSATLFAATPPKLEKSFGEVSIAPMSSTPLTFTLMNPNRIVTLDALTFSDTLPAGLVIAAPSVVSGACGGSTIIAPAGNNLITVSSASLAPQSSCTFSVNVTSDGTVVGYVTNTTSTVTSTEALPGAAASALLFIGQPLQVNYSANLNFGESYVDIGNAGTNGDPLLGPGLGAASGNLCVNVYAFDPSEELIACCSCLVTPGQTVSVGVNANLTSKTLTGVLPTSVTVKLLSTLAGGDGTGTACNNSAASVGTLANGMTAFRTTLHAAPAAGSYDTTETQFTPATLSAGEQASVVGRCASILGNASGFGICSSCKAGALGGAKL
jgi:hypothetical protein